MDRRIEKAKYKLGLAQYKLRELIDPVSVYLGRYSGERGITPGYHMEIPTGIFGRVGYNKTSWDWITNRDLDSYRRVLFADQFEHGMSWLGTAEVVEKADHSQVIAGGFEGALGPKKVVVDLGSGEAIGLLQLSKIFRNSVFIGIDSDYEKSGPADLRRRGVQLIKDDWKELKSLPDRSVDTILSLQGAFAWGIEDFYDVERGVRYNDREEDRIRLIQAVTRVAKNNAVLRFDNPLSRQDEVFRMLDHMGWVIERAPRDLTIAVKK